MKHKRELPEVEPVVLKPLWGLKPGLWLLILYLFCFLLLLFLVGFLPGIVKGGRYVNFHPPLSSSGLSVDGVYLGSADYQYFLESGSHEIEVRKADVTVTRTRISIDHPVFLTWLFHRSMDFPLPLDALTAEEKEKIILFDLNEIARYSAITNYDAVTVYPPLFANLARDVEAVGGDESVLPFACNYITSREMYEDATASLSSNAVLAKARALFGDGKSTLLGEKRGDVSARGRRTTLRKGAFVQDGISFDGASFVMGGEVPSSYPGTNEAGVKVETEPFTIATVPVSQYQWALFMEANPSWSKEKARESGLVDDSYLAGISPSVRFSGTKPITNISHHAAEAFCAWLSEETGVDVFLPTEAQWTQACLSAREKSSMKTTFVVDDESTSPSGMLGGVWEMTSTPYIPLSRLTGYRKALEEERRWAPDGDVIVKGGTSDSKEITLDTVGAVSRKTCGETIGFRIAWRENGH